MIFPPGEDVEPAGTAEHGAARPAAIAVSSRTFPRQVDARLAALRFRSRAQEADIDQLLAIFRLGQRGRTLPMADEPDREPTDPR